MKRNGTICASKPEQQMIQHLCKLFGAASVDAQHSDDRYPFRCDAYVAPLDLFIELNYHWTHGPHIFSEYNPADVALLAAWQEKESTSSF